MLDNEEKLQNEDGFEKEDAYYILSLINTWINNMDVKVSLALAFSGIIVGLIMGNGQPNAFHCVKSIEQLGEIDALERFYIFLVVLLYDVSFLSVVCFIIAIVARIKNKDSNVTSVLFFGSIAKMSLEKFKDMTKRITKDDLIDDFKEQIHTNSNICQKKALWYNRGIGFLIVTIILWFICVAFNLI